MVKRFWKSRGGLLAIPQPWAYMYIAGERFLTPSKLGVYPKKWDKEVWVERRRCHSPTLPRSLILPR